jgi:transcriptional regulator with XRE-family HTH domain
MLQRWLEKEGESQQSLARRMGVCEASISRWLTGTRVPSRAMAVRLERATRREVPRMVWDIDSEEEI